MPLRSPAPASKLFRRLALGFAESEPPAGGSVTFGLDFFFCSREEDDGGGNGVPLLKRWHFENTDATVDHVRILP